MRRRRSSTPEPPVQKPKRLQELDALAEMTRLEMELDALDWSVRTRRALPKGWADVETDHAVRPRRVKLTLRLDEDVAIYFRWMGEGYQARINAILRLYMVSKLSPGPDW